MLTDVCTYLCTYIRALKCLIRCCALSYIKVKSIKLFKNSKAVTVSTYFFSDCTFIFSDCTYLHICIQDHFYRSFLMLSNDLLSKKKIDVIFPPILSLATDFFRYLTSSEARIMWATQPENTAVSEPHKSRTIASIAQSKVSLSRYSSVRVSGIPLCLARERVKSREATYVQLSCLVKEFSFLFS